MRPRRANVSAHDLEGELRAQFHRAVSIADSLIVYGSSARNLSESSRGQARVRVIKVGRVGDAESLSPKLEAHPLAYRNIAEDSGIQVEEARSAEYIPLHVAKRAVRNYRAVCICVCTSRLTERRSVEPRSGVDSPEHAEWRNLNRILCRSRRIEVISVCSEVQRSTAHAGQNAAHSPAPQNPTRRP